MKESGGQHGVLLRGVGKDEVERGQVLANPEHNAAHEVQGRGLHIDEGGRAGGTRRFSRVPAAVLLQDDGCDRGSAVT